MNSRVEVFHSKRDWWVTAVMWGIAIATCLGTLVASLQMPPGAERAAGVGVAILSGILVELSRVPGRSVALHRGIERSVFPPGGRW